MRCALRCCTSQVCMTLRPCAVQGRCVVDTSPPPPTGRDLSRVSLVNASSKTHPSNTACISMNQDTLIASVGSHYVTHPVRHFRCDTSGATLPVRHFRCDTSGATLSVCLWGHLRITNRIARQRRILFLTRVSCHFSIPEPETVGQKIQVLFL